MTSDIYTVYLQLNLLNLGLERSQDSVNVRKYQIEVPSLWNEAALKCSIVPSITATLGDTGGTF